LPVSAIWSLKAGNHNMKHSQNIADLRVLYPTGTSTFIKSSRERFHFFKNDNSKQKGHKGFFKRTGRKAVKLD